MAAPYAYIIRQGYEAIDREAADAYSLSLKDSWKKADLKNKTVISIEVSASGGQPTKRQISIIDTTDLQSYLDIGYKEHK